MRAALLPLILLHALGSDGRSQSPMFRGGPGHSGSYSAATGLHLIGLQWRFETGGAVVSSPAVLGDTVWIGSADGKVYALDLGSGALRWAADVGSPVSSSPAVGGGRVVVTTRDGRIIALASRTGARRWQVATGPDHPFPWGHESGDQWTASATMAAGVVYTGAGDGSVMALDAASGRIRWRAQTGGRVRSTPAVSRGLVFVGSADGRVYCLDAATGARRWRFDTEGATLRSGNYGFDRRTIQSSPAVADSTVLVGARDGFLYAIGIADGRLRWRMDHRISWINGSPAIRDGRVYVGTSDGQFVQALDLATGAEIWRTPVDAVVWSSPAVTDRLVLVGDGAGRLRAVDRSSGAARWAFDTDEPVYSSPVPAGNLVVFGSGDGGVYALRTGGDGPVLRAVFLDSTGPVRPAPAEAALALSLGRRGYRRLGRDSLAAFLAARVADRRPSVVVFAMDDLPAEVVIRPLDRSLFRRYLEAGGKVVWGTVPPLIFPRDPATGRRGGLETIAWTRADTLLGFPHDETIFDRRSVRPTAAGRRWGLAARWRDGWSVRQSAVTEVLGLDDWGLAGAWVRAYRGPPGTGFVRVPFDDPRVVYWVAEYRPAGEE